MYMSATRCRYRNLRLQVPDTSLAHQKGLMSAGKGIKAAECAYAGMHRSK